MQQLILNSVLIATFVIPALVLRAPGTADGADDYGRVLKRVAIFAAVYVPLLLFIYPRLF
jgi:hypothetical protein